MKAIITITLATLLFACNNKSHNTEEQPNPLLGEWIVTEVETAGGYLYHTFSFIFNSDTTGKFTAHYKTKLTPEQDTMVSLFEVPFTYNLAPHKHDTVFKLTYGSLKVIEEKPAGGMGSYMRDILSNTTEVDTIKWATNDSIVLSTGWRPFNLHKN